ncbi:hypothetical protein Hanom_Chr06g00531031 [Helianthus anomalus]
MCFTTGTHSKIQRRLSKRHIAPISHAMRVRVRVPYTLREYTSVCFHVTIRKECSYLNTSLIFISSPLWDNVSLSKFFSFQCFKHQSLSIDISLILASFWTWFSSLRSSSNIEHKPINKYIKTPHLIFISSSKIGKMHLLYL